MSVNGGYGAGDENEFFEQYMSYVSAAIRGPRPRPPPMAAGGMVAVATRWRPPLPLRPPGMPMLRPAWTLIGGRLAHRAPPVAPAALGPGPSPDRSSPVQEGEVRQVKRLRRTTSTREAPDEPQKRLGALQRWRELLGECGAESDLHHQMRSDPNLAEQSFQSAFHGKPAGTLCKRATSMRLYLDWCVSRGRKAFPLSEVVVFEYMDSLVASGAPATRAQSFREALGFAKGFVGLRGVDAVLRSRRVSGCVSACLDTRRMRRQRDPLHREVVEHLESEILLSESVDDIDFVGFVLFCIHCRVRVGDANRLDKEPTLDLNALDPTGCSGFVDAGFLHHKNSAKA